MSKRIRALELFQPALFCTMLSIEFFKLRRSLVFLLALIAPFLIAVFVFFNQLRLKQQMPIDMAAQSAAGIWAFFMLPMTVTALGVLIAQMEHTHRTWDTLRALPSPRWHVPAAKAAAIATIVAMMTALALLWTLCAVWTAGAIKPGAASTLVPDFWQLLALFARIYIASLLMTAIQLWVSLRYTSFVPAMATGIGGTFFAVVATSAKAGMFMPWQMPVNQLASNPERAALTLVMGGVGGIACMTLMCLHLSARDSPR